MTLAHPAVHPSARGGGLRGSTSLRKRVQYDLHYIVNGSAGLDLRIILLTVFGGFIHPNAY